MAIVMPRRGRLDAGASPLQSLDRAHSFTASVPAFRREAPIDVGEGQCAPAWRGLLRVKPLRGAAIDHACRRLSASSDSGFHRILSMAASVILLRMILSRDKAVPNNNIDFCPHGFRRRLHLPRMRPSAAPFFCNIDEI